MDAASVFKDILWSFIGAGGLWTACFLLCTSTWVQRQLSMLTRYQSGGTSSLISLKLLDFSETKSYHFIYLPKTNIVCTHGLSRLCRSMQDKESAILQDSAKIQGDIKDREAFKLLTEDPKSRVIIYFHGNAGTVGQTRRTDAYRMISSGTSIPVYVLAFDYRGFGSSTGTPSEGTLIQDAINVIRWVIEVANIPADRIFLVAHSLGILGTAVACAAANDFIDKEPKVEFAAIFLCATFTDATTVFLNYSIGGYLNLLAPLRLSNKLMRWFTAQITDTWKSADRIARVVHKSSRLHMTFFHATTDSIILWMEADRLFQLAVNALEDEKLSAKFIEEKRRTTDLGEGGWIHSWGNEQKMMQEVIVKHGGAFRYTHN